MDNILEDIIEGDRRVRGKMIEANKKIDEGHQKMNKAGKEISKLTKRILKADSDLVEVLNFLEALKFETLEKTDNHNISPY